MPAEYGDHLCPATEVADIIAGVVGRPVRHNDIERGAWVDGAIAAGVVPADYAVVLTWLTETIASGHGSRPNDDVHRVTGPPPVRFAEFAICNAPRRIAEADAMPFRGHRADCGSSHWMLRPRRSCRSHRYRSDSRRVRVARR